MAFVDLSATLLINLRYPPVDKEKEIRASYHTSSALDDEETGHPNLLSMVSQKLNRWESISLTLELNRQIVGEFCGMELVVGSPI